MKGFEQGIGMGRTGTWWLEEGPAGGHTTDLSLSSAIPSRAILVQRDEVRPLSSEFTPETERQRIQQLVGALGRGLGAPTPWSRATRENLI